MHAGLARSLVFLVVLALAGTALLVLPRLNVPQIDAATPLSMPARGLPDPRFDFPDAWESAQIPTAIGFDAPLGSEHGAFVFNAAKSPATGGCPLAGDALIGIGGKNTALGDPVYATADGLVLSAGVPSPEWGKTLVIAHRTVDGRVLHSSYAHLHHIDVAPGDLVARGGKIGNVGTADGRYPAHLHFEIRGSDGKEMTDATLSSLRDAADDTLSPSPLRVH